MLRQTLSRLVPPLGFVLALLFTPHCTTEEARNDDPAEVDDTATNGVVLSAASWSAGWNTEGVDFDPDGEWSVTTNLGYRVHVNSGHLVLHRVALVPCPAAPSETASLLGLSIQSALAHEEEDDPSAIESLKVTDLLQPKSVELGANAFAPARYCSVYWLVARGMQGATTADGLDMSNRSLFLEGTWARDNASGPLLIDTWWPAGVIADLGGIVDPQILAEASKESAVHFVWINMDVSLGRMFDDIDFETDSEAVVTDAMLDNVIESAKLTIDFKSP